MYTPARRASCAPSTHRSTRVLAVAVAAFAIVGSAGATAQSCLAPQQLLPNIAVPINTCNSTYTPAILCGGTPTGPAAAFVVQLRYPQNSWLFEVYQVGLTFNPAIVVNSRQCDAGLCPFLVDTNGAGGDESFRLNLDSGTHYLIVSSFDPDHPCGTATVLLSEQLGENDDGIFRAGFDY